jgi:enoyl-CoA hydratase
MSTPAPAALALTALILEPTDAGVALVRLNRPEALNALNSVLLDELVAVLDQLEADDTVRCVVLTGSDRAFAAGADIKEMADKSYAEMFKQDFFTKPAQRIERFRKPIIAAVAGYALGGGCELAMMCDLILAADTAKFGQPEINLGVVPGIGGTQRLTRFVGKSKAMEMILTGRMMDAAEAERSGLVSRVIPAADLISEAMKAAKTVAGHSPLTVMMAKELVEAAYETTLTQGVALERRLFHSLFAFEDQKEGMAAFVEKRKPAFKGR